MDAKSPVRRPIVPSSILALIVFMASELMFFTGLLGAFIYLRYSAPLWPPLGQPQPLLLLAWINSIGLWISALTAVQAQRDARAHRPRRALQNLAITLALGAFFLIIQGREWWALFTHGLTMTHTYGATFVLLVGAHALHVVGAFIWILWVSARFWRRRSLPDDDRSLLLAVIYWVFVSLLWIFIFVPVYLL